MKLVQNIHWPRILAEGAVIVISILLAFWIDAWWDRQQDAAQEKVLLQSLLTDLKVLQDDRQHRDEYADALMEAARQLLDIGRSPDKPATDREIDGLLNDVTYLAGGLIQGSHILSMLFSGGQLASISDPELRQTLVQLRFAFNGEIDDARREVEFMETHFYPFLDVNASLAQIWGADDGQPGITESVLTEGVWPLGREAVRHAEISHRKLLMNRQFQNLLIRRIMTITNVKGWESNIFDADNRIEDAINRIEELLAE